MAVSLQCSIETSRVDGLAEHLLRFILKGGFKPGDRLPSIEQMAWSLGVARMKLREALHILDTLGAIEIRHGSGVYVRKVGPLLSNPMYTGKVTKKLLLDLVESRVQVETHAIGLAAARATTGDLMRLEALLAEAEAHAGDVADLCEANRAFHREVARASGNTILAQLQESMDGAFQQELQLLFGLYGSHVQDHREHLGLLDAIRERDPGLAAQRMNAHLGVVYRAVLQWETDRVPLA